MEARFMHEEDCKNVFTLNTWTDQKKAEAKKLLEQGYWVQFCSSCAGQTLAEMVEREGRKWAKSEYGDTLQWAIRDGWSGIYCRLR